MWPLAPSTRAELNLSGARGFRVSSSAADPVGATPHHGAARMFRLSQPNRLFEIPGFDEIGPAGIFALAAALPKIAPSLFVSAIYQ